MSLLILVPALPLVAAAITMVLPAPWRPAAGPFAVAATGCSLAALLALYGESQMLNVDWFATGHGTLTVGLELNGLTWFAAVLVAAISLAVMLYAVGYMADEPRQAHFFAGLALFVGAMLTLVLASSLLLLYTAWEIVGFASWLLIGFQRRDENAVAAAAQAFLMTRAGDTAFLLGWLLVFMRLGSVDIDTLLAASTGGAFTPLFATLLALLFFGAAIGKSAQLPLSIWLPEAMIAPTPVSALLHSATMVAAGVYLLLRLFPLLAVAPAALAVIFWLGFATAAVAALLASAGMDLKRILAWSTVSQLGEMMIAIGLGAPLAAALHLAAHASFKSTLFMGAGVIDKYAGTRDLRELGGLRRALPLTAACFAIGGLALAGVEPALTETSHDAILAAAWQAGPLPACGVLALLVLAGAYIGRAGFAIFLGVPRSPKSRHDAVTRSMQSGMTLTAMASAFITLVVLALPALLPFHKSSGSSWPVHGAALAAGVLGLVLGAASTRVRGPAPLLPGFALSERALAAVGRLPARSAFFIAGAIERIESRLDRLTLALPRAAWAVAGDAGMRSRASVSTLERALDAGEARLIHITLTIAGDTERGEAHGFDAGSMRFAQWLQQAGKRLRALQTGKLYLYTLGVFVWTLGILLAAAVALSL